MKAANVNEKGIALAVVLMLMAVLMLLTGSGLLFSGLNLKTASHLKTGSLAFYAADSGIRHALAAIPPGPTFPYVTEATVLNAVALSDGYTYTVRAVNDSDPTRAILTSTGSGPNGARRVIRVYVAKSTSWEPPAALYFTGVTGSNNFFDPVGRSFRINGNDTNYDESAAATPAPAIPGVGTNSGGVTTDIVSSLSDGEKQLITGKGFSSSPLVASVQTVATNININQLVTDFSNQVSAALTCPPKCVNGLRTSSSVCPAPPTLPPDPTQCILGTDAAPQITYIREGSDHIHLGGYLTGSGVLVLEGKVHFQGDVKFHGLVIVKEPSQPSQDEDDGDADHASTLRFKMRDRAKVFGSMLVGPNGQTLRFDIKNSAKIHYSAAAIDMVRSRWGHLLNNYANRIIAWQEVLQ